MMMGDGPTGCSCQSGARKRQRWIGPSGMSPLEARDAYLTPADALDAEVDDPLMVTRRVHVAERVRRRLGVRREVGHRLHQHVVCLGDVYI